MAKKYFDAEKLKERVTELIASTRQKDWPIAEYYLKKVIMTREEAIKELRSFIGQLTEGCQDVIKVLIPELEESEDERIRRALISYLNEIGNSGVASFNGFSIKEYITYLEKQKEPDGIWTEEDDAKVKAMCKEGDLKPSERAWLKELKNRIVQKEQKPSIKSINIDQLKSMMLQYLQEATNEKDDSAIEADTDKWARKILLGYDFEHKPVEGEWPYIDTADTLEGEILNIWQKLAGSSNSLTTTKDGFREIILHFKNYIKDEQKPAEWSEEDKRR